MRLYLGLLLVVSTTPHGGPSPKPATTSASTAFVDVTVVPMNTEQLLPHQWY